MKFAVKNATLKFSNAEGSVCRQMAEKLKIPDDEVEDWWDCQKDRVYNQLKGLRNNTIKGLKKGEIAISPFKYVISKNTQ